MTPIEQAALTLGTRVALAYGDNDYATVNRILAEDGGLAVEGLLGLLGSFGRQAHGEEGWLVFLQQASAVLDAESILNEVSCRG